MVDPADSQRTVLVVVVLGHWRDLASLDPKAFLDWNDNDN
jgi:hypothetical protein